MVNGNLVGFKPGQSGNPNGRPPNEKCFTPLLRFYAIHGDFPKDAPLPLRQLVKACFSRAMTNPKYAAVVIDRLDGKLPQPVTGPDEGPIQTISTVEIVRAVSSDNA